MSQPKTYRQNCPIALGLDILGERWTLLILRELVGGRRRYSDLRAELPGIATNLLADRLRALEQDGLISRIDLPPPVARTVYALSDEGWRKVLPVLKALADFGMDRVDIDDDSGRTPLNGFLTGLLLGFDPAQAGHVRATYHVAIDGRVFEFSVDRGEIGAAHDAPSVRMQASAADLVDARTATTATRRKSAIRRMKFAGDDQAIAELRQAFRLTA